MTWPARAALLLALLAGAPHAIAQPARGAGEFWFGPTQLPSFTGTVERYLPNPGGGIDALMFREGPQVVFPPDAAAALRQAAPPGRPVTIWGIRARSAPVITALAFAPAQDAPPTVLDRFYWRLAVLPPDAATQPVAVAGIVRQPYYTPQGEVTGAILDDGSVVLLPPGAPARLRDLLKPGARLAAEGPGQAGEAGRALVAARIGDAPGTLAPIPAPDPAPR